MGGNTQDSPPHPPIGRHHLGHFGHELSEMVPADHPAVVGVVYELDDVLFSGDTVHEILGQLQLFLYQCRGGDLRLSPRKTNIDNGYRNSNTAEIPQKKLNLPSGGH